MEQVPDLGGPLAGCAHHDQIIDCGQVGIESTVVVCIELTAVGIALYVASGQDTARAVGDDVHRLGAHARSVVPVVAHLF